MIRATSSRRRAGAAALAFALAAGLAGCAVKEAPAGDPAAGPGSEYSQSGGPQGEPGPDGQGDAFAEACAAAVPAAQRIDPTIEQAAVDMAANPARSAEELDALSWELLDAAAQAPDEEVAIQLEVASERAAQLVEIADQGGGEATMGQFATISADLSAIAAEIEATCAVR